MRSFVDSARAWKWMMAIVVVFVFCAPEIFMWQSIDHGAIPLRAYRGDAAHYMSILNSAIEHVGPTGNSYFFENRTLPSRFFVFQVVAAFLFSYTSLPIVWAALFLKLFVALSVWYLCARSMTLGGVDERLAYAASSVFVLTYGATAFDGYGLGYWFLPALVGGLYLLARTCAKIPHSMSSYGLLLVGTLFLFSFHPAYFGLGTIVTGLSLLYALILHRDRRIVAVAVVWFVAALILFGVLFVPQLQTSDVNTDMLHRMALVVTHLPVHPLVSSQLLFLLCVVFFGFRNERDNQRRRVWFVWGSVCAASLVLLNSSVVTGRYLVNDHYTVFIDFVSLFIFVLFVVSDVRRSTWLVTLGVAGVCIALVSIFDVAQYLNFRPGYYGRWSVLHVSIAGVAAMCIWPSLRQYARKGVSSRFFLALCVGVAAAYASAIIGIDIKNSRYVRHEAVQSYRPLVEYMQTRQPGVVLADTSISSLMAIYTPHMVYWSQYGFSQTETNDDLLVRYENTRLFFPDDSDLSSTTITASLLGAIDRCNDFGRHYWLDLATKIGMPAFERELCAPNRERDSAIPAVYAAAVRYDEAVNARRVWNQPFRVDYLIVESDNTEVPAWLLANYFMKDKEIAGRFVVYRKRS